MFSLGQRVQTRWRQLANGSTNRRIFGAVLTVGGASSIYYLAMVARELVLAASFGTSDALDAFLIAVSLPLFAVAVISGAFASALVPTFVLVREQEGPAEAQRLFSGVMALGVGLLGGVSLLMALAVSRFLPLFASGFSPEKLQLTQQLFFLLLPLVIFSGLATMWSAILNAGERFALAAISPALVPIVAIGAVVIARSWGIHALALGTTCGFALQFCLLGWGLASQGVSLKPAWRGANPAIRQVAEQYFPLVASTALLSGAILVDQAVAATLEPGSVATLGYGRKVVALVLGLGVGAVGTAVLPYLSKMAAVTDWVLIGQTTRTFGRLVLFAAIPLTCAMYILSEPIVALAFQRGAFTEADTSVVARVQALYSLQIPFFAMATLYSRLLSSFGANQVLLQATAIGFAVNVTLDLLLARRMGVEGIALATTLTYLVSFCFLSYTFRRRISRMAARNIDTSERHETL